VRSRQFGWLVLTTGNKSEMATVTPLFTATWRGLRRDKDVPKTLVTKITKYRNAKAGFNLIPSPIIDKPPSAN